MFKIYFDIFDRVLLQISNLYQIVVIQFMHRT